MGVFGSGEAEGAPTVPRGSGAEAVVADVHSRAAFWEGAPAAAAAMAPAFEASGSIGLGFLGGATASGARPPSALPGAFVLVSGAVSLGSAWALTMALTV